MKTIVWQVEATAKNGFVSTSTHDTKAKARQSAACCRGKNPWGNRVKIVRYEVSEHTPGRWGFRWDAANNRHVLYSDTHGDFASFFGWASNGVTTEAEDEANIRLTTSAPDLLAALQAAVTVIQGWEQSLPADIAFVADAGRAAISKATGSKGP